MQKTINITKPNIQLHNELGNQLGISRILAQVLINRGIDSAQAAEEFLKPNLANLASPWAIKDMPVAVARVRRAASKKEKILIFGDYDVDGITAVALLKTHLQNLGIPTVHYIPHRIKEGYGLNFAAGEIAKRKGIKLIITVDCGINSVAEVKKFRALGIDVIITDHHQPQDKIPSAVAIINPKRHNCPYKYKELSGVGVAYRFAQALTGSDLQHDLDLVTLGTITDSVSLNGENRIIVKEGLARLASAPRLGIQALMDISGINNRKPLKVSAVSYILGPRINASGRIDTAESALRLLLSQSASQARDLAKLLEAHNRKRQKIQEQVFREAVNLVDKEINFKEHRVIVVAGENWHPGVLGIVASRVTDRFYRPTILISQGTHRHCRGSARSIKDFSIFDALVHCRRYLENFGGHKYAAGLVIAKDNIRDFRRDINRFATQVLVGEFLLPSIEVDMELRLADLGRDLVYQLADLEPFGPGNPEPLFFVRGLTLRGEPQVLARDTLKFWVTDSEITYPVIAFGLAALKPKLEQAGRLDLVFRPGIDSWQDNQDLILEAKEIIFSPSTALRANGEPFDGAQG